MAHSAQIDREVGRILVAERSSMQCELLARALRTDRELQIVGMASDSKHVLHLLQQFEPGIALVSADLRDEPGVGLEIIAEIHSRHRRTQRQTCNWRASR